MYIDEVGNHDLDVSRTKPGERYLALTGVIIQWDYVRTTVAPAVEALKQRHLGQHPDEPIVLHRRDIIDKKSPFHGLRDPSVCAAFDRDLMRLLNDLDYTVVTAVVDKWEHYSRYRTWASHPYHYGMEVLVERYALELGARGSVGDVMAEARGGNEDRALRAAFSGFWASGTGSVASRVIQARLTSRELKLKPKKANLAGLQLADLIAYPAAKATLWTRSSAAYPTNMTGQIATLLRASKFRRSPNGRIEGWGTKWLP